MVLAVRSRPHEMHSAIREMGGTVLLRGNLTLVIDEVGLFINHRSIEATGVDAWVRLFKNGAEVPVDPHRIFINPPLIHNRIYDPRAAFEAILWDSVLGTPNPKGWRTRGTVTTVFAGTADDGVFAEDKAGPGAALISALVGSNYLYVADAEGEVSETFVSFDTSSLPDSDTVSAAVFSLYGTGDLSFEGTGTLQARIYDWGASVTTGDYRTPAQFAALTLVATATAASLSSSAYNDFTENGANFQTAISKTGTTFIVVCTAPFAADSYGDNFFGFLSADNTGTTNDPKLVVTHEAAAATVRTLSLLGVGS